MLYSEQMATLSRKQREIRDREKLILDVARRLLLEKGYLGLSMDRIAEEIEYSKGTVYQHFRCKEDLLTALAIQTKLKRIELFERAVTFDGRPRERMTAIGAADEIFARRFPDYIATEEVLYVQSIACKASESNQEAMQEVDGRCVAAVCGTIRGGIEAGDLEIPPPREASEIAFGIWGMTFGSRIVGKTPTCMDQLGIKDTFTSLRRMQQAYLDGWNWRPLSHEWDYDATRDRILEEVFADERAAITI